MIDTFNSAVICCARCHTDHNSVAFLAFVGLPVTIKDTVYQYWGMCPTVNQPILMAIIDDGEDDVSGEVKEIRELENE